MRTQSTLAILLAAFFSAVTIANAFTPSATLSTRTTDSAFTSSSSLFSSSESGIDPAKEVVGKTIIVKGNVQGGYIRTCIKNEASRFRRLIGTMSPPEEDSDTATIYVEGKRRNVDGFIRWCEKGSKNVGLSQNLEVVKVTDEVPTGLYDNFYVKLDNEE